MNVDSLNYSHLALTISVFATDLYHVKLTADLAQFVRLKIRIAFLAA